MGRQRPDPLLIMAIIYPEHCRGTTAGALRQVKQQGFTTAGTEGGLFSSEYVKGMQAIAVGFTRKTEPLGKFMSQLTEAKTQIEDVSAAVSAASRKMVEEAAAASESLTASSRKMREATEKLTAQMGKFHAAFANAKFDEQAKAAQSLADAMERLAELEEKGMLSKVIAALHK